MNVDIEKNKAQSQNCKNSGESPGYVQICPHCGENVPMGIVQQGGLHMGCYGTEIDVWFVSLPENPEHGFCEIDPKQVMWHLDAIEPGEPYLVQKKTMAAGLYYNLQDFAGF